MPLRTRPLPAALLLATTLAAAPASHGAESYDNCVGFIDTLPAVINTQGTWCLRDDLSTAITSGNAITIAANNVTIDCNHFKLGGLAAGPTTEAAGIRATERQNATVRNCGIRGFNVGVLLSGSATSGSLVEDSRFDGNLFSAIIAAGSQALVQRNRVYDTGGGLNVIAMQVFGDVIDNTVDGVTADEFAYGIQIVGEGSVARGNRIRGVESGSPPIGLLASGSRVVVTDNQVIRQPSAPGTGIYGNIDTFCSRNVVAGFAGGAIFDCIDAGGNSTD